jgi:hypothetical protein
MGNLSKLYTLPVRESNTVDISKLAFQSRRPDFAEFRVMDADILVMTTVDWAEAKEKFNFLQDLYEDQFPVYVKLLGVPR